MMRGMTAMLEKHHGVWIRDEAVVDCVRLSARYIPARQLPDKSVSVLDTACARVSIAQQSVPSAVEDARRRIVNLHTEIRVLEREEAIGTSHSERLDGLREALGQVEEERSKLEERWQRELELVKQMHEVRDRIQVTLAPPRRRREKQPRPAPTRPQPPKRLPRRRPRRRT